MALNTNNENAMKRILPKKVLERGYTHTKGTMEALALCYLHHCVHKRKMEQVKKIVRLGPSSLINLTNNIHGFCALHLVTLNNDVHMAQVLLSLDAHPDIPDKSGRTAMMMAAELGNVNMMRLLACYEASVNLVDAEGKGLLFYCLSAKRAQAKVVELALEMGADVNNVSFQGKSVFMFACEKANNCENICLQLLEKGADPNIIDQVTGNTSLMLAAKAESVTLIRELLHRGVNPNAVNKVQQHTAHFAAFNGSTEVLRMLAEYSADFSMMSNFCWFMLQINNPSMINEDDDSIESSYSLFTTVTAEVIEKNENLQEEFSPDHFYKSQEKFNKISECIKEDNFDYVKLSLEFDKKFSVDIRDRFYRTPLMTACINGKYNMAKFLITNKADINASDQLLWTSLHHTCFKGHADIVRLLLKHGADIDAQTTYGVTPLMRAIMSHRTECVKVLLEAGANIDTSKMPGQDCMLLAQKYGGKQICELVGSELERRQTY